jgi:hypothetical protein
MTEMATEIRKSGIDVVGDMVADETGSPRHVDLILQVGIGKRRVGHRCAERRGLAPTGKAVSSGLYLVLMEDRA